MTTRQLYIKSYNTFLNIKNRKKTREIRLNRGFISRLSIGDKLIIQYRTLTIETSIKNIDYYEFFESIQNILPSIFPDITDINEARKQFYNYYNDDLRANHSIVAIHLEVI